MKSGRDWLLTFENVKSAIQGKRRQGVVIQRSELGMILCQNWCFKLVMIVSDIDVFAATLKELNDLLLTMEQCPLEYEIVSSEIARRHVLLDNLKKSLFGGGAGGSVTTMHSDNNPRQPMQRHNANQHKVNTSNQGLIQEQQQVTIASMTNT